MAARKNAAQKARRRAAQKLGAGAEFIRQHPNLSARELVRAAARRGLSVKAADVSKIRASTRGQRRPAGTGRRNEAAAEAGSPEGNGKPLSKSEFIRSRPPGMTARQVVEAAAEQGMSLSEHFVYNIRSSAKKRAARDSQPPSAPGALRQASFNRPGMREAEFRRLVLDLGLERSRELLADVERKLTALVAGRA